MSFVQGDVTDREALHSCVARTRPDVIFHLAAETGTGQSMDEVARYCEVNVTGTANLIEATHALDRTKIVLASSRAIYGEGAYRAQSGALHVPGHRDMEELHAGKFDISSINGVAVEPVPTPEKIEPNPVSVYASTKLMQELLIRNAAVAENLDFSILRFQNVFGDGQSLKNPYTGVLSIFIAQLLRGEGLNIYEDGHTVRDFVYVEDVVSAICRAVEPDANGGTFNVGTGQATTIQHAAETIISKLGMSVDRLQITGDFRAGDIRYAVADITAIDAALGWRPATSFEDGTAKLIEWSKAELSA